MGRGPSHPGPAGLALSRAPLSCYMNHHDRTKVPLAFHHPRQNLNPIPCPCTTDNRAGRTPKGHAGSSHRQDKAMDRSGHDHGMARRSPWSMRAPAGLTCQAAHTPACFNTILSYYFLYTAANQFQPITVVLCCSYHCLRKQYASWQIARHKTKFAQDAS